MNTTVNSTARSTGKKKADASRTLTLKPVHMRKLAAIIDVKGAGALQQKLYHHARLLSGIYIPDAGALRKSLRWS